MFKPLFTIITILLFTVSISAQDVQNYGTALTITESTPISNIVAEPEKFVGQKVLIEGTVVNVCEMRGCWIEVAGEGYETIRVKVNDGEIVFPLEAKGKKALVEGEVYSIEVESEEACSENENEGKTCTKEKEGVKKENGDKDTKECCSKKKTKKIYQIKGLGAVIK